MNETIAELRRLLAEATPQPWGWTSDGEKSNDWSIGQFVDRDSKTVSGGPIERERYNEDTGEYEGHALDIETICYRDDARGFSDAKLIVALVNAAPELLDRLEQLEAENKGLHDDLLDEYERVAQGRAKLEQYERALREASDYLVAGETHMAIGVIGRALAQADSAKEEK